MLAYSHYLAKTTFDSATDLNRTFVTSTRITSRFDRHGRVHGQKVAYAAEAAPEL